VSSAAARQAAYKRRQRHGEAVLRLRADYFPLVAALLESGRLTEADALDRDQVESAIAEVVRDWVARWQEKG
jgi:hypothetical protein